VNTDSVSLDDLVEHMEPLLLPADRRSPVPKIDGPEPIVVAKQLFAAFEVLTSSLVRGGKNHHQTDKDESRTYLHRFL